MSFNIGDVVKVHDTCYCGTSGPCEAQVVAVNNGTWKVLDTDLWWAGYDPSYKVFMKHILQIQAGVASFGSSDYIAVIFNENDAYWNNANHGWYKKGAFTPGAQANKTICSTPQATDPNLYCSCNGPTKIVNICGDDVVVCTSCKKERIFKKSTTFVF